MCQWQWMKGFFVRMIHTSLLSFVGRSYFYTLFAYMYTLLDFGKCVFGILPNRFRDGFVLFARFYLFSYECFVCVKKQNDKKSENIRNGNVFNVQTVEPNTHVKCLLDTGNNKRQAKWKIIRRKYVHTTKRRKNEKKSGKKNRPRA